MASALAAAALLRLAGADAIAFAHAQFSSDIKALAPGDCGCGAWLDAQGRVQAVFVALRSDADSLLLWLPRGDAAALASAVGRYRLRSRVQIDVVPGWQVLAAPPATTAPPFGRWLAHADGCLLRPAPTAQRGLLLAPAALPIDAAAALAWQREDLGARLPWLETAVAGRFVPQALELERIGALSFDKGCYPGQEIAARLHFRGGNKRGLRAVVTGTLAPPPGTTLSDADGQRIGEVLYAVPAQGGQPAAALVVAELAAPAAADDTAGSA